jgi:hypothetical protein
MLLDNIRQAGVGFTLALALGATSAQAANQAHPAIKRAFELPPSADLHYDLAARQRGLSLKGDATVNWRAGDGKYDVRVESRVAILGTLLDNRSQGAIDDFGLAPAEFSEKRMRKDPTSIAFDRGEKRMSFSEGEKTYPLKGGEQDRVSITWQLAAVARAAGDKFKPGSEWPFFVAGRSSAEAWTFKVVKREKVNTGLGQVDALLVSREALPGSRDQSIEIWLAPEHEWYPVKIRFTEGDKETIEQTLKSIAKPAP